MEDPPATPPAAGRVDWDPHAPDVVSDPRAAYDVIRARCPVARDGSGGWTLFRHADVVRVLHDHHTFSNVVSQHISVPSGMDPPVHTAYRRIVERYFEPDLVAAFEPYCRQLAVELVDEVGADPRVDVMTAIAFPFAARVQCAYLGWPLDLADALIEWTRRNHEATASHDREALAAIARELEDMVADLIASRRADDSRPPADLTDRLLRETVDGRPLTLDELTSILRNWTMGEVGTIAASIGILAWAVADDLVLQHQLRHHPALLPDAIDELLRIHGPLVSNRRTVTRRTVVGDCTLEAGDRLTINWIAANRDPEVFDRPDTFRLDRTPGNNLLYGAGIHVCPGASLSRLELRVMLEELLATTHLIEPLADRPATLAEPPASGYASLPLALHTISSWREGPRR